MPKSDIPFNQYEHIRTWKAEGFRLELFDTGERGTGCDSNKFRLAYQFFDSNHRDDKKEQRIFAGDRYFTPDSTDGDSTVGSLLAFFWADSATGDWTQEQRDWQNARGEDLSLLAMELGEAARAHCILCGETGGAMMRYLERYSSPADTSNIFLCYDCNIGVVGDSLSDEWSAVPGYQREEKA